MIDLLELDRVRRFFVKNFPTLNITFKYNPNGEYLNLLLKKTDSYNYWYGSLDASSELSCIAKMEYVIIDFLIKSEDDKDDHKRKA